MYVGSADLFLKTITDPTVSHIVVIAHLDLSGLPPVDTTSLAIARLLPTLKSLKVSLVPSPSPPSPHRFVISPSTSREPVSMHAHMQVE